MTQKQSAWAIIITVILLATTTYKKPHPISNPVVKSPTQIKLEKYIGDKYIAEVISNSKYPFIIAAIGKVESDYRPQAIGDGGESHGLYQIQPRHWHPYDDRVGHQTAHCERILGHLFAKYGVVRGLERYNGGGASARRYSKRVLELARTIEKG